MSKHRRTIRIDKPVDAVVKSIVSGVLSQNQSAIVKEELDFNVGTTECHIRMVERYSIMSGNYMAMTITFLADTSDPGKLEIAAVAGDRASSAPVPITSWRETLPEDPHRHARREVPGQRVGWRRRRETRRRIGKRIVTWPST